MAQDEFLETLSHRLNKLEAAHIALGEKAIVLVEISEKLAKQLLLLRDEVTALDKRLTAIERKRKWFNF